MTTRSGNWMQTFTGKQFWPLDPRADEVYGIDIAHALSLQCRFAGHCKFFYSVAEHSCHVHDAAEPEDRLWALLHDAAEAYVVDIPRPLKKFIIGFAEIEQRVMLAVCEKYGMSPHEPSSIKYLDNRILATERDQIMAISDAAWDPLPPPLPITLVGWSPLEAKDQFLRRLGSLV